MTLSRESLLLHYTLGPLLSAAIKSLMMEKNHKPAAAVWLDREKVPIKMFAIHQMNMFKIFRAVCRNTLLSCAADLNYYRDPYIMSASSACTCT